MNAQEAQQNSLEGSEEELSSGDLVIRPRPSGSAAWPLHDSSTPPPPPLSNANANGNSNESAHPTSESGDASVSEVSTSSHSHSQSEHSVRSRGSYALSAMSLSLSSSASRSSRTPGSVKRVVAVSGGEVSDLESSSASPLPRTAARRAASEHSSMSDEGGEYVQPPQITTATSTTTTAAPPTTSSTLAQPTIAPLGATSAHQRVPAVVAAPLSNPNSVTNTISGRRGAGRVSMSSCETSEDSDDGAGVFSLRGRVRGGAGGDMGAGLPPQVSTTTTTATSTATTSSSPTVDTVSILLPCPLPPPLPPSIRVSTLASKFTRKPKAVRQRGEKHRDQLPRPGLPRPPRRPPGAYDRLFPPPPQPRHLPGYVRTDPIRGSTEPVRPPLPTARDLPVEPLASRSAAAPHLALSPLRMPIPDSSTFPGHRPPEQWRKVSYSWFFPYIQIPLSYEVLQDVESATNDVRARPDLNSSRPRAWYMAAKKCMKQGWLSQALQILDSVKAMAGDTGDEELTVAAHARMGRIYLALGNYPLAETFLLEALESPVVQDDLQLGALITLNLAMVAIGRDDYVAAVAAVERALSLAPGLPDPAPVQARAFLVCRAMAAHLGVDTGEIIGDKSSGVKRARSWVMLRTDKPPGQRSRVNYSRPADVTSYSSSFVDVVAAEASVAEGRVDKCYAARSGSTYAECETSPLVLGGSTAIARSVAVDMVYGMNSYAQIGAEVAVGCGAESWSAVAEGRISTAASLHVYCPTSRDCAPASRVVVAPTLIHGLRLALGAGDKLSQIAAHAQLSKVYGTSGEFELANYHALERWRVCCEIQALSKQVGALIQLSCLYKRANDYSLAILYMETATELAEESNMRVSIVTCLIELGYMYATVGRSVESRSCFVEVGKHLDFSAAYNPSSADKFGPRSVAGLPLYTRLRQDYFAGRATYETLSLSSNIRVLSPARILNNQGVRYALAADYASAEALLRRAQSSSNTCGRAEFIDAYVAELNLACVYIDWGQPERALGAASHFASALNGWIARDKRATTAYWSFALPYDYATRTLLRAAFLSERWDMLSKVAVRRRFRGLNASVRALAENELGAVGEGALDEVPRRFESKLAARLGVTLVQFDVLDDVTVLARVSHTKENGKGATHRLLLDCPYLVGDVVAVSAAGSGRRRIERLRGLRNCLLYLWARRYTEAIPVRSGEHPVDFNEPIECDPELALRRLYVSLIQPLSELLPSTPESEVVFVPDEYLIGLPFAALRSAEGDYVVDRHTVCVCPGILFLSFASMYTPDLLVSPVDPSTREGRRYSKDNIVIGSVIHRPCVCPQPTQREALAAAESLRGDGCSGRVQCLTGGVGEHSVRAALTGLCTTGALQISGISCYRDPSRVGSLTGPVSRFGVWLNPSTYFNCNDLAELQVAARVVVISCAWSESVLEDESGCALELGPGDIPLSTQEEFYTQRAAELEQEHRQSDPARTTECVTEDGLVSPVLSLLSSGSPCVVSAVQATADADSRVLLFSSFHARMRAGDSPAAALRTAMLTVRECAEDPHEIAVGRGVPEWAAYTCYGWGGAVALGL